MIITADEVRYEVRFYHDDPELASMLGSRSRNTDCEIYEASDYELNEDAVPLVVGTARCMYLDNFSRAKGCKLSFERAIASFPRHTRTEFWREYFKIHTNGKRKGR
jgi:hypothetical protein